MEAGCCRQLFQSERTELYSISLQVCGRRSGLRRPSLSVARDSLKGLRKVREGRGRSGTLACPCPPGTSEPTEKRDSPQPQRGSLVGNSVRRHRSPLGTTREGTRRSPLNRLEADSVRRRRSLCGRRRNSSRQEVSQPYQETQVADREGRSSWEPQRECGGE